MYFFADREVPAHKCYFKRKAESLPTCHHCQEKISLAELKIEGMSSFGTVIGNYFLLDRIQIISLRLPYEVFTP